MVGVWENLERREKGDMKGRLVNVQRSARMRCAIIRMGIGMGEWWSEMLAEIVGMGVVGYEWCATE